MSLTRVCVCLANAKQNCAQECANPNIAEIPPALSIISVDTYAGFTPGSSGLDEVKQAKAMYDIIFPKLHPHQQVMLVPGTFACSNLSYFPLDDQAKNNVEKLEGYFSWAKQEKRIAGFNPWVSAAAPFASSQQPKKLLRAALQYARRGSEWPSLRYAAGSLVDANCRLKAERNRALHHRAVCARRLGRATAVTCF